MRIESPAEACAALAVLIAGADEVGTLEESRFLFETVASMPVFSGLDRSQFAALMEATTNRIWSSFPVEGGRITDEGAASLLALIREALPAELRTESFKAAVGLARADGIVYEERLLLHRLCDELEIDPGLVRDLLEP